MLFSFLGGYRGHRTATKPVQVPAPPDPDELDPPPGLVPNVIFSLDDHEVRWIPRDEAVVPQPGYLREEPQRMSNPGFATEPDVRCLPTASEAKWDSRQDSVWHHFQAASAPAERCDAASQAFAPFAKEDDDLNFFGREPRTRPGHPVQGEQFIPDGQQHSFVDSASRWLRLLPSPACCSAGVSKRAAQQVTGHTDSLSSCGCVACTFAAGTGVGFGAAVGAQTTAATAVLPHCCCVLAACAAGVCATKACVPADVNLYPHKPVDGDNVDGFSPQPPLALQGGRRQLGNQKTVEMWDPYSASPRLYGRVRPRSTD